MNTKDVFIVQLDACHENTWFVSLLNSVDGLTEKQANWKPNETTNSIFEIVNHLIFYNERHLNRFKNIPVEKIEDDNTFRNRKDLSWDEAVKKITEITTEWTKAVKESDEENLDEKAPVLAHLTIHTTYHTGQIIYNRKLQGIWNPEEGVVG
ncbi:DinB family protein [Rossellomorea sp. NS-SX7]|uniref:DinB family protein n=1 Tax=Rossellomorea sp. NS-SX7 TaxID=3463856 RepID=UPI00405805CD